MPQSEPFLKWAGGKRWLASKYAHLFPDFAGRYIEPFLGSGAVFFFLQPNRAILSDRNEHLIEAFQVVKEFPNALHDRLEEFQALHCDEFYYDMRAEVPSSPIDRAARFIYLNRTCFNGLYRVNKKGEFNVPKGTKAIVRFEDNFLIRASQSLRAAELRVADFEETVDAATQGDFLFVDPPYTVSHNNNGFIKYNDVLFSWADQKRLAEAVRKATQRGVLVFVSNANHKDVIDLYKGFLAVHVLTRHSVLAGETGARKLTSEVGMVNFNCLQAPPERDQGACLAP